jgi:hypothetical protein
VVVHRGGSVHVLILGGIVLCAALAGCTPAAPQNVVTTSPAPVTDPDPEPTEEPVAVVTIAAVDVDGLHVTVAGFVTLIEETDATCEFDLTSAVSGETVTTTTLSVGNVGSTSCGSAQVDVELLSKGPWDVSLHYVSADIDVTSESVRVEVP